MHERVDNFSGLRIHTAMLIICLLAPFVCGSDGRSNDSLNADPVIDAIGLREHQDGEDLVSPLTDTLGGMDLSCPRCNVILLNTELLRADHVGLISGGNLTPELDRLFNGSIIFTDVTAASGETFRSNWATLTGLEGLTFNSKEYFNLKYPYVFPGDLDGIGSLINRTYPFPTLLEVFNENGYFVININDGPRSGEGAGLLRGVDFYKEHGDMLIAGAFNMTGAVISENRISPFILLARNKYLHMSEWRILPKDTRLEDDDILFIEHPGHKEYFFPRENKVLQKKIYAEKVSNMDDALGPLFDILDVYRNNSIIVLYSNHGESLGDNDIIRHGIGFQSCVYVPLMILHPNIDGPVRVRQPVSLIDLAPTLYDMIGIDYSHDMHGTSLVPLINNGSYPKRFIYGKNDYDYYVRMGDFKYLVRYGTEKILINITADPYELTDISNEYPQVVSLMDSRLTVRVLEVARFKEQEGVVEEEVSTTERIIKYVYTLYRRYVQ
ncbi:sulfatase [Candidatus Altiarchaeota archaeon]